MNGSPKVIISASGMCEAGRIRHHLKHNLWDSRSSVVFVGYQAEGTLGRSLINGIKNVNLFGEPVQVNADIINLEGFSGHADKDGLMRWLSGFKERPRQVFLVHGEPESKKSFANWVEEELGYLPTVVETVSEFELQEGKLLTKEETLKEVVDEELISNIRKKINDLHEALETVLYNSALIVGEKTSPEKNVEISNILLQLEKETLTLGTALSKTEK